MSSEQERTLWCGNLCSDVSDEILYELFLQAGPLERVHRPRDRESGEPRAFAFITFEDEETVPYAAELFQDSQLYGRSMRLQPQGAKAKEAVQSLKRSGNGRNEDRYSSDNNHNSKNYNSSDRLRGLADPSSMPNRTRSVPDHLRPGGRPDRRSSDHRDRLSKFDAPYGSRPQRSSEYHDRAEAYGGRPDRPRSLLEPMVAPVAGGHREHRRHGRPQEGRRHERDDRDWSRRQGRW